jgi:hypothetical protein
MKAEVKSLYSLEVEDNLIFYWPDDLTSFGTWIRAYIGLGGERKSVVFDFLICTQDWLKLHTVTEGAVLGRQTIIFDYYDYDAIEAAVERCVAFDAGGDWAAIAARFSRPGVWQFDGHTGASSVENRVNDTAG